MGRKKQLFRPNVLTEGVARTSRWRFAGTGMCEIANLRSLLMGRQAPRGLESDFSAGAVAAYMQGLKPGIM